MIKPAYLRIAQTRKFPLVPDSTYRVMRQGNLIRFARLDAVYWIDFLARGKVHLFAAKPHISFSRAFARWGAVPKKTS